MKTNLKKIVSGFAVVALVGFILSALVARAADVLSYPSAYTPIFYSANTTNTANNPPNFPSWPTSFTNLTVTNITPVNISGAKIVSVQVFGQSVNTNSAVVIWQLGRSVNAQTITNSFGTNSFAGTGPVFQPCTTIDWFATVTNTLPANVATNEYANTFNFSTAQAPDGVANHTIGGFNYLYIGWITAPANCAYTNYGVYVNAVP
jgi:hypothetical protein